MRIYKDMDRIPLKIDVLIFQGYSSYRHLTINRKGVCYADERIITLWEIEKIRI